MEFIVLNLKEICNEEIHHFFNDIAISTSWMPQSSSSKVYVLSGGLQYQCMWQRTFKQCSFHFHLSLFCTNLQTGISQKLCSAASSNNSQVRHEKLQNFLFVWTMSVSIYHATETKMNPSQIYQKKKQKLIFSSLFSPLVLLQL